MTRLPKRPAALMQHWSVLLLALMLYQQHRQVDTATTGGQLIPPLQTRAAAAHPGQRLHHKPAMGLSIWACSRQQQRLSRLCVLMSLAPVQQSSQELSTLPLAHAVACSSSSSSSSCPGLPARSPQDHTDRPWQTSLQQGRMQFR